MMIKYRVNEVAKDLGVTSKEIIEVLSKVNDTPHKSQTALTEGELNAIFEKYTQTRQVENFDAYFAQADEKPEPPKPAVKPAEPAVQQAKPAPAAAPAVQAVKQPATPAAAAKPAASAAPAPQPQQQPAAQQRPAARQQAPAQQSVPNGRPAPQFRPNTNRPPVGGAQGGNRPPYQGNRPQQGGQQQGRPQQGGQFQQNRPGNRPPYQGGQQRGGFQQGGRPGNNQPRTPKQPKPTYQRPAVNPAKPAAPLMVDEQGNKGRDVRVVDMRTSQVNLDKYNEKYERIAPTNFAKDNIVKKQKLNQRSAQRGKPNYSRREQEMLKMRKLEMERQRRQKLEITLPDEITVGDLALKLKIQAAEIIKKLMLSGVMAAVNDVIDYDTAALVAMEIGAKVEHEVVVTIEDRLIDDSEDNSENLHPRDPVVVVMGHVDHGKTSLLDAIRNAHVTAGEAGGITQHIGAYRVEIGGKNITFLDTPGHAAFTAMRARGAQVTDIAILVVAADDGIMPQTVEAINHAKAAGVSIIVAINKMDKPTANPDKVKQELTEYELVPEEWGGDIICVPVSAKTHEGIDTLLEMVNLVAEVKELKANPDRLAKGTVIEAKLDKGRGPVATLLVQNGTLRTGDIVIAGTTTGRVRMMLDDRGNKIEAAGPSVPVEITGLDEVPAAGDIFNAVEDEKLARELVEQRKHEQKEEMFKAYHKVTLDNLFDQIAEGDMKELPIIVKADVAGSVEAVKQSLEKLSNSEVRVRVIHGAVGAVSESDVMLAAASGAIIIGFNVRPDPVAKAKADADGVDIRLYRIIYDAIEEVSTALKGMLAPKYRDVDLGRAEVRQVYTITNVGKVAGCYVLEGKILRNANIRIVRDGIIVADDKLDSLKRFKDDVKEVASGYECGMSLQKFADIKEGDIFEAYEVEEYRD
ncbi:translation initiation factor IF-2 [Clostridiaceae bacterium NSJ-31]|uniref:Translation initiation factor IF-2 n=1 Tax=Ligaoa zhengdingensis TaxID=2763658 RepID=A0A926DYE9_9FIRM|nr:translation initiation factor IF-2 [Ligaoa zhengdingensis]MBC8545872.1 translation initiation factor IF-2 [Ligaoa zhengdingensis]